MSFITRFFTRFSCFFSSRSPLFRVASLLVAGMLLFFVVSLGSSTIRVSYGLVFEARVVKPFVSYAKRFSSKKEYVLNDVISAEQQGIRRGGSLSSPYVEIGLDERFPLLVRVWVNVDSSHVARVTNNDKSFPLSYERAVSAEGFVPIVGLSFGANSFDLEIVDSNSKRVAKHTLTANIEDSLEVQGWINVTKQATKNDFLSASVCVGTRKKPKHCIILDDFGKPRWVYGQAEKSDRSITNYARIIDFVGNRIFILDDEGAKVISVDVFGNKEIVFDGDKYSKEYYHRIHHDFVITDKGTMLALSNHVPKESGPYPSKWASWQSDRVIEVDLESGSLLREIDLREVFPADWEAGPRLEDHAVTVSKKSDWLHLNSIDYSSEKNLIALSGRNQNVVFALDYDSGELAWLFSDPEGGLGSSDPQVSSRRLSAPPGYRYHKGQHDVKFDGDRLLFFDNATLIKDEDGAYIPPSDVRSRIVEARLDLPNKKVVSVKTYEPRAIYSRVTGGYDFSDDKYLICYCGIMKDVFGSYMTDFRNTKGRVEEGQVFEIDKDSGAELMHFSIKGISYRVRYFDWQTMVR